MLKLLEKKILRYKEFLVWYSLKHLFYILPTKYWKYFQAELREAQRLEEEEEERLKELERQAEEEAMQRLIEEREAAERERRRLREEEEALRDAENLRR